MAGVIDPFLPAQIARLTGQYGSPLLILDCERVRRQYRQLERALPGVELHYALKPLPHAAVVRALEPLGARFDLATGGEIALVRGLGIPASRCIHTHPVKRERDIREALDFGIDTFVADTAEEIAKFAAFRDRAALLIRLSFRSPDAVVDLSRKFGCGPQRVPELLRQARELGVRVRGLSFHVGSQAVDPAKYVEAIRVCAQLFAQVRENALADFDVLDIGGGFPVPYRSPPAGAAARPIPSIEAFCEPIRAALRALPPGVRIIAEPGRFIVAPAGIGVATVMGRAQREGRWWYYLDDGVYGLYSGKHYEHAVYPIEALGRSGPTQPSVLSGPTCDSIDVIDDGMELPELRIGDLVVGRVMGAYTWATACEFNFFPKPAVVSVNLQPGDEGSVLPTPIAAANNVCNAGLAPPDRRVYDPRGDISRTGGGGMSRVLTGSVIAGIAVFLWGFVFWGMMPLAYSSLSRTADDAAAGRALAEHLPRTGTYLVPGRHNEARAQESLFEAGPVAMVFFNREGRPMMSGMQMAQGLGHSILVALVLGLALYFFGGAVAGYGERVALLGVIGLASAVTVPLANMIWWYFPAGWQLWNALYQAVTWLIMALILAHFVPRAQPAA
jgi:ornithine decarboxylase